jgi:hypothetical protein
MCAVSVVYDYWSARPDTQWTRETFNDFKEIVDRLDRLDEKLAQPDCHDPSKAAWMAEVESMLREREIDESA